MDTDDFCKPEMDFIVTVAKSNLGSLRFLNATSFHNYCSIQNSTLMAQRPLVYKCKSIINPQTLMMMQLKTRQDLGNYSNPVASLTCKTTPRIAHALNRVILLTNRSVKVLTASIAIRRVLSYCACVKSCSTVPPLISGFGVRTTSVSVR